MTEDKHNKTALITGAASGIGSELTRLFAKDGYNLVLVDINAEGLDRLAYNLKNQYGTQTSVLAVDLADANAPQEIYTETTAQGHQIDVLVNNAGFGEYGKFATETDLQKELAIVQVNAVALMHLTKLYLKDMVARNEGKILLLGSEVSVIPNPMMAVYGATKAFIKSFGEAIRNELKDTKITVTVLMPGATNTNFFKTAGAVDVKGADPNKTADPASVAKEGYDALMSGKDHVVAGWMNKARVAMAYLIPDPLLAANVRDAMTPKEEANRQQQQTIAIAIGVSVVVAGAFLLLSQKRSSPVSLTPYQKVKYGYKARRAEKSAQHALASVGNSVKGAFHNAKETVENALVS